MVAEGSWDPQGETGGNGGRRGSQGKGCVQKSMPNSKRKVAWWGQHWRQESVLSFGLDGFLATMSKTGLFLVVYWSCTHFQGMWKVRAGIFQLVRDWIWGLYLWKTGGRGHGDGSGEMNITWRENQLIGSWCHNRRENHLSNGSCIHLGWNA